MSTDPRCTTCTHTRCRHSWGNGKKRPCWHLKSGCKCEDFTEKEADQQSADQGRLAHSHGDDA